MNHKIEGLTNAIKALQGTETGFLVNADVYDIMKKYGVDGRDIGMFGYVKITKPPAEQVYDIIMELKKILAEETLKECTRLMPVEDVEELMERLVGVTNE